MNIALQHVTRTPLNSTRLLVVTLRHKFWLLLLFCTTRSLVSFPCHGARAERLHVYEYFEVTRLEARNSPWKALSRAPVTTKALPPPATQSTTINCCWLVECKEREGHTVVELLLLLWWVRRVLLSSSVFSSVVVVCCWILRILAIQSQRRVFGLIVRVLSIKALLGGDECWWCVEFTREIIIFCDTFCSTFHFGATRKEWLQPTFLSLSDVLLYIGQWVCDENVKCIVRAFKI